MGLGDRSKERFWDLGDGSKKRFWGLGDCAVRRNDRLEADGLRVERDCCNSKDVSCDPSAGTWRVLERDCGVLLGVLRFLFPVLGEKGDSAVVDTVCEI